MKNLLIAVLTALLLPATGFAQFALSGTVRDRSSNQVISGANITLKGVGSQTTTNENGQFTFPELKKGQYLLQISHIGFVAASLTVTLQDDKSVALSLTPANFITDEVLVTATRAAKTGTSTYKNVSKQEIVDYNFGQDLPFLLQNTPGVVVTSDAGNGIGYTGIRIRGSDATRINITINGIPYNDSESQGTFWVNMPDFASSVENIQIQRGIGTSTNGAGSFGGSINVQTSAISQTPYAEINNATGSFGTLKNTIKVGSGLIGEHFSFEGRLSRIASNGFIDRGESLLRSYFLSGAYQTPKSLLRINVFSGSETTYQAWNGIPEAKLRGDRAGIESYISRNSLTGADEANILNSGARTYNSFLYKDQTDNYWQDHYQALFASNLSNEFTFNLGGHYTYGRGYYEEYKPGQELSEYGLNPVTVGGTTINETDLVRRRWLNNDFYGATFSLDYKSVNKLNWTLGGAYNKYAGDHFGQVIFAQFASNGNGDRHYYDNLGVKNDFNTFAKLNLGLTEKLLMFADLQYRHVNYRITGLDKNRSAVNVQDNLNLINPKIGFTYLLSEQQHMYSSFSMAGKEPNRDDYLNFSAGAFPKQERMQDLELGYRVDKSRLKMGVNVYAMYYRDQLVVTGKINDVGEYFRQNVDRSYRAGIEADLSIVISTKVLINMNAALSRNKIRNFTEFTDDYDHGGQRLEVYKRPDISFSPSAVAGSEIVFKPTTGLAFALQSRYVSKQYLDNTQNEQRTLNAYFVNNLRLGYDFSILGIKNVNIGLLMNNLFNERYESNGYTFGYIAGGSRTTENFYFPQAGTNFLTSINLKF